MKKHFVIFSLLFFPALLSFLNTMLQRENNSVSLFLLFILSAFEYYRYQKQSGNNQTDMAWVFIKTYVKKIVSKYLFRNILSQEVVATLISLIVKKDEYTGRHSFQVEKLAVEIGRQLKLSSELLGELSMAALLHDIGKIAINENILNKPGKLTEIEYKLVKYHSQIGYETVKKISCLEKIAEYILYHHERYDGKGYPYRLKGKEIPLISRIISVADVYDAISSKRVYRPAMDLSESLNVMVDGADTQFDPEIVDALLVVITKKASNVLLSPDAAIKRRVSAH